LWVLFAGLLVQGLISLLFRRVPTLPPTLPLLVRGPFGIDSRHAWIHVAWGIGSMVLLSLGRTWRTSIRLAVTFGIFYSALGIAGVVTHHPFGLELDLFENAFHLTAGPLTLLLGLYSYGRRRQRRVVAAPS
jgi:hypothetical protein